MNTREHRFLNDRITINPDLCNGKPTIRGKRITVQSIVEYLSAGDSYATILENFPSLNEGDIKACLEFASQLMDHKYQLKEIA